MSTGRYRLIVLGCALGWFMVGLHVPLVHGITHHGRMPHWSVLATTVLPVVAAVAALWALLRAPRPGSDRSASGPATT